MHTLVVSHLLVHHKYAINSKLLSNLHVLEMKDRELWRLRSMSRLVIHGNKSLLNSDDNRQVIELKHEFSI